MKTAALRPFLSRLLPIALFALGCFPSRGLYFLLHASAPDGRYHAHQPLLSAPSSRTPRLKAAKVKLPARLSRIPRSLKENPDIAVPERAPAYARNHGRRNYLIVRLSSDLLVPEPFPSSPPPGRAPPASV